MRFLDRYRIPPLRDPPEMAIFLFLSTPFYTGQLPSKRFNLTELRAHITSRMPSRHVLSLEVYAISKALAGRGLVPLVVALELLLSLRLLGRAPVFLLSRGGRSGLFSPSDDCDKRGIFGPGNGSGETGENDDSTALGSGGSLNHSCFSFRSAPVVPSKRPMGSNSPLEEAALLGDLVALPPTSSAR